MSRSFKILQLALASRANIPIIFEDDPLISGSSLPIQELPVSTSELNYTELSDQATLVNTYTEQNELLPNVSATQIDGSIILTDLTLLDCTNNNYNKEQTELLVNRSSPQIDCNVTDLVLLESSNTCVSGNNSVLVAYSVHSDSDDSTKETLQKNIKRRKRCQTDKSTWADRRNAVNREKGRNYFGRKKVGNNWEKVSKEGRNLKPRCKCARSKTFKCAEILDDSRKEIFDSFWLMNWGEKKVYIDSLVVMSPTQRPRDRKNPSITKRTCSILYQLKVNDKVYRVCKTMFLNTLDIGKSSVWNWKSATKDNFAIIRQNELSICQSENKVRCNAFKKEVDSLKEFLDTIPKMESHYCRKTTEKEYLLPEWATKRELYNFYVTDWCPPHDVKPVSVAKFNNTLDTENISLFRPKKDECEKCRSYKLGLINDAENAIHIMKKEEARAEKEKDKSTKKFVFTVDMQALLLAPKSNVSSLYYKTKLCIHNFCIYNLRNKDAYCYLWNETEGGVNADEFASIVVKFILEKIVPNISLETNPSIIVYSDGCTSQNRNVTISNALLNVAMLKGITIEQKYLEVGHTQMEVDSMHALIEKKNEIQGY